MKWIAALLKVSFSLLVLSIPVVGVWVASSLAAFWNGPVWAALGAGLLAFPILPGLWDLWAMRRRVRRGQRPEHRVLTSMDRLILRTLVLNAVFVGGLLWLFPQAAFTALSTRGDWMLEGRSGAAADNARLALFAAADGLEWLYLAYSDNPYKDMGEGDKPAPPNPDEIGAALPERPQPPPALPPATGPAPAISWPLPGTLHPAVATLPADAKVSIEAVARYIAAAEPDPFLRVKALHDFAADHVRYDFEALDAGRYPPQDARTVFSTGRGVCAGYANLMRALGQAIGVEVVYVTGNSRDKGGEIGGDGHAWNAVKIEGAWYLVDVTWDAGHREGGTFEKEYRTDYLLTPPDYFVQSHFPDEPSWQLLAEPLSRGDFMRQPMLDPGFYIAGLRLIDPTRSQVTVEATARVQIANPKGQFLMLTYRSKDHAGDTSAAEPCDSSGTATVTSLCPLPRQGTYLLMLLINAQRYGTYHSVGQIEVNRP